MGMETSEWYNTKILVGNALKRGKAWHYKKEMQGDEPNHYDGAIPMEDIQRRLFNYEAISCPVFYRVPCELQDADGVDDAGLPYKMIQATDHQAVVHGNDHNLFSFFKVGYARHQFNEWLVGGLQNLVDDSELGFGSAGILQNGAVAFVTIEMPESIEAIPGFEIRSHIMATTSHNGKFATTFKAVDTFVVCDNTHACALAEDGQQYKLRHSKYSTMKLQNARDALGIIHQGIDNSVAEITALSNWEVSSQEFARVMDILCPVPKLEDSTQTAVTRAENKRGAIAGLYAHDDRVAPWAGTALGVLQAFNTWEHHVNGSKKNRVERNILNIMSGKTEKADNKVIETLRLVTA